MAEEGGGVGDGVGDGVKAWDLRKGKKRVACALPPLACSSTKQRALVMEIKIYFAGAGVERLGRRGCRVGDGVGDGMGVGMGDGMGDGVRAFIQCVCVSVCRGVYLFWPT